MNMIESLWNEVRLARPSGEGSDWHTADGSHQSQAYVTRLFLLTPDIHMEQASCAKRLGKSCIRLWFPLISCSSHSWGSAIDVHTWARMFKRQEDRGEDHISYTGFFSLQVLFSLKIPNYFSCVYFTFYSFLKIPYGMVINNITQRFLFTCF